MDRLLDALKAIPVSKLIYSEWLTIGIVLYNEGFPCSIWDSWSQDDLRYHPGECEEKWKSFKIEKKQVTARSIYYLAKQYGWKDTCQSIDWNDIIAYDGYESHPPSVRDTSNKSLYPASDSNLTKNNFTPKPFFKILINNDNNIHTLSDVRSPYDKWEPVQQLRAYISALFRPNEYIGYVTNDAMQDRSGRWYPTKGVYYRTACKLLRDLDKYPDDLGASVGDWFPEAGAWIRINPLDGRGVKDENVVAYRHALIESDTLSVSDQEKLFRELQLPIAAMVFSGGKSIHATVLVDAPDYKEYQSRVLLLYNILAAYGVTIDKQNKNPSRLSRMPGVTRNGLQQKLIATKIGKKSWDDWIRYILP
ncbi:MAG: PriCT-2 domain-containing protein [Lachnospiraceae bacterium]|nr:PriCT-2 domain-containing protein [Lachnospiraceae bacterium]